MSVVPAGPDLLFDHHEASWLPMWREALAPVDWLKLKASRVYYGIGVPKGDRSAVIVVPGFLGYDAYLFELFNWLWRVRYKPYFSHIGHNAECPNILTDHLMHTVHRAYDDTGMPVHLVGHSLGGVISRGAAGLHPDMIASVTTLGSPFRGVRAHPFVLNASEAVRRRIHARSANDPARKRIQERCFTASCNCEFSRTWRQPFPENVQQTAIFTKTDGIVDWEMCVSDDESLNFEVDGTHCGLAWNPAVFKIIAERLASARRRRRSRTA